MHIAHEEIVFTRSIHGSNPVRLKPPEKSGWSGKYDILDRQDHQKVVETYYSAGALLKRVTQDPCYRASLTGYFRLDKPTPPTEGSVLDLFSRPTLWTPESITIATAPVVSTSSSFAGAITISKPAKRLPPVQVAGEPPLGIDLAVRGGEVRKLFYAGFGNRVAGHGYDPEEVLQEVYRGLLARNKGICPWDIRKSSFGHYVFLVAEGILNNFHRKEARRRSIEQVGLAAPMSMKEDAGASGMVDAASVAETSLISNEFSPSISDGGMPDAIRRLSNHLEKKRTQGISVDLMAVTVAKSLAEGFNRQEIAKTLGVTQGRVNQAISSLREHAGDWF